MQLRKALLAICLLACGGDSTGPGPNGGGGEFFIRANIDGAWEAAVIVPATMIVPGTYVISGTKVAGGNAYALGLSLTNIGGTGNYALGVSASVPGGIVTLTNAQGGWSTPLSGAAGTLTITALTTERIAGTFTATLEGTVGSATGTSKTVANGEFNLELRASVPITPMPENVGSIMSATINGAAWNAAAVGSSVNLGNTFILNGTNTARTVSLNFSNVSNTGTYNISANPLRAITVGSGTGQLWSSAVAGATGSLTITSITATRIRGTFIASLPAVAGTSATGTVTITNGTFDIGRPF